MNMIAAPNDPMIENRTFDEIAVGDSASSEIGRASCRERVLMSV